MSRVERTENPSERRGSEQLRQAREGRNPRRNEPHHENPDPAHTPDKAEGEESDVDEALRRS